MTCFVSLFPHLDVGVREDHSLQHRGDHVGEEPRLDVVQDVSQGIEGGAKSCALVVARLGVM